MRVLICGAGQVGLAIAQRLSFEKMGVTIVDQSPELIARTTRSLNVQGFVGSAAHPDILDQAQAGNADLLIAATQSDETNMIACQVAHSLFGVPKKIARVRHPSYLDPTWGNLFGRTNLPVDAIISPEIEIAKTIQQHLAFPGTLDVQTIAEGRLWFFGVRMVEDLPMLNKSLRDLRKTFSQLRVTIVGIWRNGKGIIPSGSDTLQKGDNIYLVCDRKHQAEVLSLFHVHCIPAKEIVIAGGGNVGLHLARILEKQEPRPLIQMIEKDPQRAEYIAGQLEHTLVLHGSISDPEFLEEVGVERKALVALTNHDATNIIACLLGRRLGCSQTTALIKRPTYMPLRDALSINSAVVPHLVTVSSILRYARPGRILAIHQPPEGFGEVIEIEAIENSQIVGTPLNKIKGLQGIRIGVVLRKEKVIVPNGETVIEIADLLVIFVHKDATKKLASLFSANLDYF